MIDRMEAEQQLIEIQTRRTVLFATQRGTTYKEGEFFAQLRNLDMEERYWRTRMLEAEMPGPPTNAPDWALDLWKTFLGLQADVMAWRSERRAERVDDAIERDRARRTQYMLWGLVAAAVWANLLVGVLWR